MQLPALGSVFHGRYRLDSVLGRGGFATVFRATDTSTQREVAVKVLSPTVETSYDRELAVRFQREVRVVSQLTSPFTVRMLDFGQCESGLLFMVFELVEGRDLAEVLADGTLPESAVVHILDQTLQALEEAHEAGLLHRDIKPGNIIVYNHFDDPWRAKLLDFGVAKDLTADAKLTATGYLLGTPRYMSPEQLGARALAPASDIYSLGLVMYELLSGPGAVHGNSVTDQMDRVVDGRFDLLDNIANPALRETLVGMLRTDVRTRIPSAAAARARLSGRGPTAIPSPRVIVEGRPSPNAAWMIGGALAVLVLGIVAALTLTSTEAPRKEPDGRLRTILTPPTPRASPAAADVGAPDVAMDPPDLGPALPTGKSAACSREPSLDVTKDDHTLDREYRELRLTLPSEYAHGTAYPVVFFFHDQNQSAGRNLTEIGVDDNAARYHFVGLTPRDRTMFNLKPWRKTNALDVMTRALDVAGEAVCINLDEVYVVGTGDGGRMVERVRCLIPSLRGAAVTGYRSAGEHCHEPSPVPFIQLVGRDSTVYPADGGFSCLETLGRVPSRSESEAALREASGCEDAEETYSTSRLHTCRTWTCATPLVACDIDGGHGWKGTRVQVPAFTGCYGAPPQFDQFATIWKFFQTPR